MSVLTVTKLRSRSTDRTFPDIAEEHIVGQLPALLGLLFPAVGMSLELDVIAAHWLEIIGYVAAHMVAKALMIYPVARAFKTPNAQALERAVLMAQGSEFAFVLYGAAAAAGSIDAEQNTMLTAIVIVEMAITPLAGALTHRRVVGSSPRATPPPAALTSAALVIGFGRVGRSLRNFSSPMATSSRSSTPTSR